MSRELVDNVLSGMKADFKAILNLEHPIERKKMFNLKSSSKLSATLLALILGASVFMAGQVWAAEPVKPQGELVVALADVGPPQYNLRNASHPYNDRNQALGTFETLMDFDGVNLLPMLADSWEITPKAVTYKIRKDVSFHDGWGKLTAYDIVFSYQEIMAKGTVNPAGGTIKTDYTKIEALDAETVRMELAVPTVRWSINSRYGGHTAFITSKRAFDEKGRNWQTLNAVGTGPFKVAEHKADDFIRLEAVPDHWRQTPAFATVMVLDVPEEATRIAMLKTGKADIAAASLPVIDQYVDIEGVKLWKGRSRGKGSAVLTPAGQYYAKTKEDGTPLDRALDTTLPWIGDPNDPDSMEAARKVRWAMAMAIDRELINKALLAGQGCAQHVVFITDCHPSYQKSWDFPYDVEKAKQYLTEAGYPNGFDFTYFIPMQFGRERAAVAEALIGMFQAVGLRPKVEKAAYSARRPTMVSRTIKDMWMGPWGTGADTAPDAVFDMQGITDMGVWNPGIEYPKAREFFRRGVSKVDDKEAWAVAVEFMQWAQHEMVAIPTVSWWTPWAAGPKVKEWDMPLHNGLYPSRLEYIVPGP